VGGTGDQLTVNPSRGSSEACSFPYASGRNSLLDKISYEVELTSGDLHS
jgi:hypothetical protein